MIQRSLHEERPLDRDRPDERGDADDPQKVENVRSR